MSTADDFQGIDESKFSRSTGGKVTLLSLEVVSESLPKDKTLSVDPATADVRQPLVIKEGVEHQLMLTFRVDDAIAAGLRYVHVVKRSGLKVDKLEEALGPYGPAADSYVKLLAPEEAPSGIVARVGSYVVHSRIVDEDETVHADFTWSYKLATEW